MRLTQLPLSAHIPRLLGVLDDGDWVAVVLEDVAGRHPRLPWRISELERVLGALEELQSELTPCPVPDLPRVVEQHQDTFGGWRQLEKAPPADLDSWAGHNLSRLAEREGGWAVEVSGDTVLHGDLRADNVLLTKSGSVVFLDWPGACQGVDWFDPLVMAPSVAVQGGPDPEWLLSHHAGARQADPDALTTLVVATAGYFLHRSLLPAPPGLPALRAFQAKQARAALSWAAGRTGWS